MDRSESTSKSSCEVEQIPFVVTVDGTPSMQPQFVLAEHLRHNSWGAESQVIVLAARFLADAMAPNW
jgi:hypothetical protein